MTDTSYIDHQTASNRLWQSEQEYRWSFMLKPKLSIDGNKWCALLGDNLQDGVAGFGDSPDEAYAAFDKAWTEKLPSKFIDKDQIMKKFDEVIDSLKPGATHA